MRRFREVKYFELGRLPTHVVTLQEVGILSTLTYSSLFGQNNGSFEFQLDVLRIGKEPRQTELRLGWHVSSIGNLALRLSEGVRLGEGVVHPRRTIAHKACSWVRLGERFFF